MLLSPFVLIVRLSAFLSSAFCFLLSAFRSPSFVDWQKPQFQKGGRREGGKGKPNITLIDLSSSSSPPSSFSSFSFFLLPSSSSCSVCVTLLLLVNPKTSIRLAPSSSLVFSSSLRLPPLSLCLYPLLIFLLVFFSFLPLSPCP